MHGLRNYINLYFPHKLSWVGVTGMGWIGVRVGGCLGRKGWSGVRWDTGMGRVVPRGKGRAGLGFG